MNERRLFVYGTLRRVFGHPLHAYVAAHSAYAGTGWVLGALYDLGRYPGAVAGGTGRVHGEVYVLDRNAGPRILAKLDEYEGYLEDEQTQSLFVRRLVQVRMEGGDMLSAWMYWYRHPVEGRARIESGDYAALGGPASGQAEAGG